MGIEERTEAKRTSRKVESGSFGHCFQSANSRGYEVDGVTKNGWRLHYLSSDAWATITQVGEGDSWELIIYNYRPSNDEPHSEQ